MSPRVCRNRLNAGCMLSSSAGGAWKTFGKQAPHLQPPSCWGSLLRLGPSREVRGHEGRGRAASPSVSREVKRPGNDRVCEATPAGRMRSLLRLASLCPGLRGRPAGTPHSGLGTGGGGFHQHLQGPCNLEQEATGLTKAPSLPTASAARGRPQGVAPRPETGIP